MLCVIRLLGTQRMGKHAGGKTKHRAGVDGMSTPANTSSRRLSGDTELLHFVNQRGALDSQACSGTLWPANHPMRVPWGFEDMLALPQDFFERRAFADNR